MKFKDLEPGMLTKEWGLIVEVIPDGEDGFVGRGDVIWFLDPEEWDGRMFRTVYTMESFTLLCETGSPEHARQIERIISECNRQITEAKADIRLLKTFMEGEG